MGEYPDWVYYPVRSRPPAWVLEFTEVVRQAEDSIAAPVQSGRIRTLIPIESGHAFRLKADS